MVAYIAQGKRSLSIGPRIGDRVPAYAAAGAKAMIAYYDPDAVEAFLAPEMRRFTHQTITDLETLRRQLKEIRRQGVAFCREEISVGVNAIGAPIFDHENNAIAAVVIAGLVSRVKCDIESPMVVALKRPRATFLLNFFIRRQ